MISERSRDTKNWSNYAENSDLQYLPYFDHIKAVVEQKTLLSKNKTRKIIKNIVYSWLCILNRDPRHIYKNVNWHTSALKSCHTKLREHDEVFSIALWAGDTCGAVASLFLINPALKTRLMNPFSGTAAAARTHPLRRTVILIGGKTHPTAPETHTHTHQHSARCCIQGKV